MGAPVTDETIAVDAENEISPDQTKKKKKKKLSLKKKLSFLKKKKRSDHHLEGSSESLSPQSEIEGDVILPREALPQEITTVSAEVFLGKDLPILEVNVTKETKETLADISPVFQTEPTFEVKVEFSVAELIPEVEMEKDDSVEPDKSIEISDEFITSEIEIKEMEKSFSMDESKKEKKK